MKMEQLELWIKTWEHPVYEFFGMINSKSQDYALDTLDPEVVWEAVIIRRLENGLVEGVNYRDFTNKRRVR